jgi:hypothetical protein
MRPQHEGTKAQEQCVDSRCALVPLQTREKWRIERDDVIEELGFASGYGGDNVASVTVGNRDAHVTERGRRLHCC